MRAAGWRRGLARVLPGVLLVATFADDVVFGGLIVGARLRFGTVGSVAASTAFVAVSIAMAAATAWALRRAPLQLSARVRRRLDALRSRRLGRHLLPHPDRPVATAVAAATFGSVAPIIVAALDSDAAPSSARIVVWSGVAYGAAFGAAYGLVSAVVGIVA